MPHYIVRFEFLPKRQKALATGCLTVQAKSDAQAVKAIRKGLPPHTEFTVVGSLHVPDLPRPPQYLPGAVTRVSPAGESTSEGVE